MCDFREPEQYFEENNIPLKQRKYNGIIHLTQIEFNGDDGWFSASEILEEGYYLIATTGSFYAWCDGNKIQSPWSTHK